MGLMNMEKKFVGVVVFYFLKYQSPKAEECYLCVGRYKCYLSRMTSESSSAQKVLKLNVHIINTVPDLSVQNYLLQAQRKIYQTTYKSTLP